MDSSKQPILSRKFKFKLEPVKTRYWLNNSAVKTLHANTLTTGIPFGERFFIGCVTPYIKHIKCPLLKKNATEFARQEINHSKEHLKLYAKSVKPFYPKLKANGNFYQKLSALVGFLVGNRIRLAMVAAMEHNTAVAADLYLSHPELLLGADDKITALWRWHFIEEIEHRTVAFDIFKASGGNYLQRAFGFFISMVLLIIAFCNCFFHMAIYDKLVFKPSFYVESFHFFWGKEGILRRLAWPILSYLRPGFHPAKVKEWSTHEERLHHFEFIQKHLE